MSMKKLCAETAPMAGWTDFAFRRVLRKCGARIIWTEMISVAALAHGNAKTHELLKRDRGKTVVQLFGHDPEQFRKVIESGVLRGFHEININMGCPARKIVTNGDGVTLMKNPALAKRIVEACVAAANAPTAAPRRTKMPVSVKMRLGYKDVGEAVALAKICETAGASRIIVHGRFAEQGYSGKADHNAIGKVVRAVKIPVIANGDIRDQKTTETALSQSGAAGVMMGRALLGAPWRIKQTTAHEKAVKRIMRCHIKLARKHHGERHIYDMRKHLLAYCKHLKNGKETAALFAAAKTCDEVLKILKP